MRRVLFDENMPRKLRDDLSGFSIRTVQEEDWAGLSNGELLRRAEASFDVFVTADQRLPAQQNLRNYAIAVVMIVVRDTRLVHLRPLVSRLSSAIEDAKPGTLTTVSSL